MERSQDAWLSGPSDLREADVEDVPVEGASVRVRGLSARYSAEVQGQLKLVTEGREQIAKIDVPSMELLQFVHGCVDPVFTEDEARRIQERFGPAFRKVVAKIDELSGIDKQAVEAVEERFHLGGASPDGPADDEVAAGSGRSDIPVRAGA